MAMKKNIFVLSLILFSFPLVLSYTGSGFSGPTNNFQYTQPTFNQIYSSAEIGNYWPILNNFETDQCEAVSDFIIGIPPGGCSPGVVRSDLLAEQNVPVFCSLYAVKVNPLIKVSSIKSISFRGDYPEGVAGVSFHPARASVNSYQTLLGDPTINNIGYVVIILKREKVEANMEEWIAGNLTATIRFDAAEAYGTGKGEYYLNSEDGGNLEENSFWNGKGYLNLEGIGEGKARIQILSDKNNVYRTLELSEGETSNLIYFPGYYCRAGIRLKLNELVAMENTALLKINGNDIWVREGSKILDDKCRVKRIEVDESRTGNISISCPGRSIFLRLEKKTCEGECLEDEEISEFSYFNESNEVVRELIEEYPFEKSEGRMDNFGEDSLYEQIRLAGSLRQFKTQAELMDLFIDTYSDSKIINTVIKERLELGEYNYSNSYSSVAISNSYFDIALKAFKNFEENSSSVDFSVESKTFKGISKGERITILNDKEYITIREISANKVSFEYVNSNSDADVRSDLETVMLGDYSVLGERQIHVSNIDVIEAAYVSLIPEVKNTKTEADFTFRIGIEKRAIELSPEKTKRMLKNLNESIERLDSINKRLETLVKGWKGACFATSAVLMIKNMISGVSGEALARQKVMDKYKVICDRDYPSMTRTQCYNELSSQIDEEVSLMATALKSVNDKMDSTIQNHKTSEGLFGQEKIVNQESYVNDLKKQIPDEWSVEVEGQKITKEDLTTSSQVRAVLLYEELNGKGGVSEERAKEEMESELSYVSNIKRVNDQNKKLQEELNSKGITDAKIQNYNPQGAVYLRWDGQISKGIDGIGDGKSIQYINYKGTVYLFVLSSPVNDLMNVNSAYTYDGSSWVKGSKPNENFVFSSASASGCSNPWTGKKEVIYYEAGANKGLPAIVPFDIRNGWYVMVPNSAGTFIEDSPKGYSASADVSYFKICNIGSNGLMEKGVNDLCQSFDVNSAGSVKEFIPCPSMTSDEVKELYNKAREAIRRASSQAGQKEIEILGEIMDLGAPMGDSGDFECQDFMSPDDCKLMFNVCDPVICPPSRCDLGGKMPVSDVIQTGIIGSLILCLPNAKEGIMVPICVSGVQAGLEAYVSILKSKRDCLEKSLETGEYVGICDQITSIYLCEFFWRQLAPVMDVLLPRLIGSFFSGGGESVRGGGEYLLVEKSWSVLQKSVDYFQNTYAVNAFKAFNIRSVSEVGGEFCRAFVGTSVPDSAEGIESILEPESPPQFYAHFSETLFTEATVPSTSQYKVYYHIYAGDNKGVQYQVYLKNPPESNYYRSNPYVSVKTGYIVAGNSADESIDFTAPSGYKELCVVIDSQEECGFKQVTTDLGLDYLAKKYTQEQAETSGITSEKECISGSPSALALASPNIQSGAEEMINPEIALRGIVRVCASVNPEAGVVAENYLTCVKNEEGENPCGKGYSCNDAGYCVDSEGNKQKRDTRWKDVGYCGTSDVRCWLDVSSVKEDLESISAIEGSSISILEEQEGLLENSRLDLESVRANLVLASKKIKELKDSELKGITSSNNSIKEILDLLDSIIGTEDIAGAGTNADRAEALALKASLYRRITLANFDASVKVSAEQASSEESLEEEASSGEIEDLDDILTETWSVDSSLNILYDGSETDFKLYTPNNEDFDIIQKDLGFFSSLGQISSNGEITIEQNSLEIKVVEGVLLKDLENYEYKNGFFSKKVESDIQDVASETINEISEGKVKLVLEGDLYYFIYQNQKTNYYLKAKGENIILYEDKDWWVDSTKGYYIDSKWQNLEQDVPSWINGISLSVSNGAISISS